MLAIAMRALAVQATGDDRGSVTRLSAASLQDRCAAPCHPRARTGRRRTRPHHRDRMRSRSAASGAHFQDRDTRLLSKAASGAYGAPDRKRLRLEALRSVQADQRRICAPIIELGTPRAVGIAADQMRAAMRGTKGARPGAVLDIEAPCGGTPGRNGGTPASGSDRACLGLTRRRRRRACRPRPGTPPTWPACRLRPRPWTSRATRPRLRRLPPSPAPRRADPG